MWTVAIPPEAISSQSTYRPTVRVSVPVFLRPDEVIAAFANAGGATSLEGIAGRPARQARRVDEQKHEPQIVASPRGLLGSIAMTPHLRDWFAAHIAASLAAEQRLAPGSIAARAYDVADALMEERGGRFDADLPAFDDEPREVPEHFAPHLLDDVMPVEERDDDAWVESARERPSYLPPSSERPGLARTQLELPLALVRKTGA
jgi:hypothetical protein